MKSATLSTLALETVQTRWADILSEVKSRRVPTEALLKRCAAISVEGITVILAWQNDVLKEKFETGKDKRLVEDVMSEVLDQKVMIRSIVEDPMIRAAMQLGAKVTPVSNR